MKHPVVRQARRSMKGFTLIELMVAAVVVAILAAVAIPQYSQYVVRGRLVEAQTTLTTFATAMQQFYQDNRTYAGACGSAGIAAVPAQTTYFTFTCPTQTATTFTATATGRPNTSTAGFVFTLDQNANRATTGAPSGWTTNASCWIRNNSGSCN